MIVYEGHGDIFRSDCQTITCPVNAVGVMGAGLALAFKRKVDGLFEFYVQHYPPSYRTPAPHVARQLHTFECPNGNRVLLFPTKAHWDNPSSPDLIRDNLKLLARNYQALGIQSLTLPALGCGLGGLNYERDVRAMVHEILGPLPLRVALYV